MKHLSDEGKNKGSEAVRSADGDKAAVSARVLSPAAQRALAEAEARRLQARAEDRPREIDGRGGAEPVRYGDWEVKGIASDF